MLTRAARGMRPIDSVYLSIVTVALVPAQRTVFRIWRNRPPGPPCGVPRRLNL